MLPETVSRIVLSSEIARAGLSKYEANILDSALPALRMELDQADGEIDLGVSKIGGTPDLPSSFPWPEWNGKPLGFIGQIDLAAAGVSRVSSDLPMAGHLLFFYDVVGQPWGYDPKEVGYSRIVFLPAMSSLTQAISPDGVEVLPCSTIRFARTLTFPTLGTAAFGELEAVTGMTTEEQDSYLELIWRLDGELLGQSEPKPLHQFLGHSRNIQGDMQLEAQLVTNGIYCGDVTGYRDPMVKSLIPGALDWTLLFQLDTDDAVGYDWGDSGMLYYWIKRSDLGAREFQKHWMTLQCY